MDPGFVVILARSRNGAEGKRAAGAAAAGHKPCWSRTALSSLPQRLPPHGEAHTAAITPSLTAPYPELRCPGAFHPATGPSRSHGKEGADGLICFPLLTAANLLGRHPSPWRPPLKVLHLLRPDQLHPSSPGSSPLGDPTAGLEETRTHWSAPLAERGQSPGAPGQGLASPWPLALALIGVLVVVALRQIRCLVEQAIQTQTVGIQGIRGQFTGNFPKLALHRFR